mmetsp:Transcript_42011/g.82377  ORF Transcript_42011/g.82377 Transcript_42011/m.82377 type:complete len:410 (+) Transcript_42011:553-1782(+)
MAVFLASMEEQTGAYDHGAAAAARSLGRSQEILQLLCPQVDQERHLLQNGGFDVPEGRRGARARRLLARGEGGARSGAGRRTGREARLEHGRDGGQPPGGEFALEEFPLAGAGDRRRHDTHVVGPRWEPRHRSGRGRAGAAGRPQRWTVQRRFVRDGPMYQGVGGGRVLCGRRGVRLLRGGLRRPHRLSLHGVRPSRPDRGHAVKIRLLHGRVARLAPGPLDLHPLDIPTQPGKPAQEQLVVIRPRIGAPPEPSEPVEIQLPLKTGPFGVLEVQRQDAPHEPLRVVHDERPPVVPPRNDGREARAGTAVEHVVDPFGELGARVETGVEVVRAVAGVNAEGARVVAVGVVRDPVRFGLFGGARGEGFEGGGGRLAGVAGAAFAVGFVVAGVPALGARVRRRLGGRGHDTE